ncbi:MAG: hypothetical protein COW40_09055 [Cytophagales bacterium CG17_big_fil_post_rev_8_21_14_2_50_40_13]|nr:MAG: hypothetical protein COW40_09055 [Cytophagales bacterium CG17_big_fil_post_rev_8_21_14_2_50_40_13]
MIFKKLILPIILLMSIAPNSFRGDGLSLLKKMSKRYDGKWYKSVSFEQKTTRYSEDGSISAVNTWYEAMELPSNLAIKFDDMDKGNGLLFRNDSIYQFNDGQIAGSRVMYHPLLILGFSVYSQPVEKTEAALITLGFDLNKAYQRDYNGKQVYVVGALEGDETSNQFWIEKDRLLFVKMIQNFGENRIQEVFFDKYEALGGGWIAPEVRFYMNGKMTLLEEYTKIETPNLNAEIFDPKRFIEAKW